MERKEQSTPKKGKTEAIQEPYSGLKEDINILQSNYSIKNKNYQNEPYSPEDSVHESPTSDSFQNVTESEVWKLHKGGSTSSQIHDCSLSYGVNSPESPSESKNCMNVHKNLESDNVSHKKSNNFKGKDNFSHRSNRLSQNSRNVHSKLLNSNIETLCDQVNMWRIDPFNVVKNEQDMPLAKPQRHPALERTMFKHCTKLCLMDIPENDRVKAVSTHLKNVSNLWRKWLRNEDSDLQLGLPIQVGTANGSSSKSPLRTSSPELDFELIELNETMEITPERQTHDRACKRKANTAISASGKCLFSSDEEEVSDDSAVKKKKKRRVQSSKAKKHSTKQIEIDENVHSDCQVVSSNQPEIVENDEIFHPNMVSLRKRRSKSPEIQEIPPEPGTSYPKRSTHNVEPCEVFDISAENEEKTEVNNAKEESSSSASMKVKPLLVKDFNERLLQECSRLKDISIVKIARADTRQDEAEKERKEAQRKRQEAFEREKMENQKREEMEKMQEMRDKKWRETYSLKQKANKERSSKYNKKQEEEKDLPQNSQNLRTQASNSETNKFQQVPTKQIQTNFNLKNEVNCPICNVPFPYDAIENHAAECEQYDTNKDENVPQTNDRKTIYECQVCSFKTSNETKYGDHVSDCFEQQRRQLKEPVHFNFDELSMSPIRTYKSISEQPDSCIDYKNQFNTRSRATKKKR